MGDTGPSELWAEAMLWAGENGASHTKPGLWRGAAGVMDGIAIDVAANTHDTEVENIPPFGIRLTSPTHMMVCIFTPAGGVLGGGGEGDEDRLIEFFKARRAALATQEPTNA